MGYGDIVKLIEEWESGESGFSGDRHNPKSNCTSAGASLELPMIGKLLGHSQPATTARYAHLDADPMRRAADMIGNQIAAAMDGKAGMVVPLADRSRVQIQSRQKSAVIGDLVAAPKRQGFVNYHNSIDIFNYGSFVPKIHAKKSAHASFGCARGIWFIANDTSLSNWRTSIGNRFLELECYEWPVGQKWKDPRTRESQN